MNVAIGIEGNVVVENVGDIVDIQTPRCDIRCNEQIDSTLLEVIDGFVALALLHIPVERPGGVASGNEGCREGIGFLFGAAKDEGLIG